MTEAIILTAINLFWGWVWFNVGRCIGRKETKNESNKHHTGR